MRARLEASYAILEADSAGYSLQLRYAPIVLYFVPYVYPMMENLFANYEKVHEELCLCNKLIILSHKNSVSHSCLSAFLASQPYYWGWP